MSQLTISFLITLGRTSKVGWSKAKNRTTLARYHQGLIVELPTYSILLPKRGISGGVFIAGFTATCQQFGINSWTYLQDSLTKLPNTHSDW